LTHAYLLLFCARLVWTAAVLRNTVFSVLLLFGNRSCSLDLSVPIRSRPGVLNAQRPCCAVRAARCVEGELSPADPGAFAPLWVGVKRKCAMSRSNGVPVKPRPSRRPSAAVLRRVSDSLLDDLIGFFEMLADRNRLKIVLALAQDGEQNVSTLTDLLGQSQPAVSHHLTLMRAVGLVGFDRRGKSNYYFLKSNRLRRILEEFFTDASGGSRQLQFDDFVLMMKKK
jgi:ArsR family transcriptional regulator